MTRYDITDGLNRIAWKDAKIDIPVRVGGMLDGFEMSVDLIAEELRSLTLAVSKYLLSMSDSQPSKEFFSLYEQMSDPRDSVMTNLVASAYMLSELGYSVKGDGKEFLKDAGIE